MKVGKKGEISNSISRIGYFILLPNAPTARFNDLLTKVAFSKKREFVFLQGKKWLTPQAKIP